ncbi:hypothetical protein B0H15DRAFT_793738 [Mycena belliarum]|uniref:CxC1-like cysteine cluster associated with KDZ transposases domain-containing protein n=1 Tax=Mycena belliarum TaxID=1033014 RepID=A0AAD6XI30_9AGAR|nr:hypothetical protein B0H15DRAFT_794058 [Mycena belliae]KAJ7070246.1 hypothetical protein B0H15DRAFT_793738 [Mycena belliae]
MIADCLEDPNAAPGPASAKKSQQWARWTHEVIPKLVPIYIKLIYDTQSLRNTTEITVAEPRRCPCNKRILQVAVVRMNAIEHLQLRTCACAPAPTQLLKRALFACSPLHPSLAVDLQVLDFVSRLFVNLPPNNTAVCNTLESFLASRGYKLTTRDTLRVRFGNALEWYISLQHATKNAMDKLLNTAREAIRDDAEETPTRPTTPEEPRSRSPTPPPSPSAPATPRRATQAPAPSHGRGRKRAGNRDDVAHPPANPFPLPPPRTRPSDYLISRCPACFGGLVHDPSQLVDIDVCADACFTQKRRRKGGRDPPRTHPDTVFVPESTAELMGAHVEGVRQSTPRPSKKARTEDVDGYEGPLKVPNSTLDECETSFKAADDKREKASTRFFDDTGIMGLLCRHDRVLWLVNMRTAGEKQYYVLVLLETLFQHLPNNIRVGVLYDIACQLHRSCIRWHFLEKYLDRILFGVSVFHAFGHRWPCQMIYHPLKCCGFGFTNGEGCERFWHSISKLIAYLRVSGYHHRLYTIDMQIEYADKMSLGRLGAWLVRRTHHCETKLREALADLKACDVAEEVLRAQWANQIAVQTKPLQRKPGQSKTAGQAAVEQVIQARHKTQSLFERVKSLEEILTCNDSPVEECLYAEMALPDARKAHKNARDRAAQLERGLGVDDTTVVQKLKHAEYYTARMNGKALKERLRAKLRDRKFELDPIERSNRLTDNLHTENQRNEHTNQAIQRREPNITKLASSYNKICQDIAALIKAKKAPAGVVAPLPVPAKGIYQIDVDDALWQDLGLDGDEEGTPPLWLKDDKVRSGIRALLQKDRCGEEAPRLLREQKHLRVWFATEWKAVNKAIGLSNGAIRYHLEMRRDELLQLCVLWKKSLDRLPKPNGDLPEWGPTAADILECQIAQVTASWGDGYDSDEEEDAGEDDDDLFEVLEAVERADNNRAAEDENEATWASDIDDFWQ